MKRHRGRERIQTLLGQLYTKLLNVTGDDEIEDEDEEESDDEPYSTPAFLPYSC